MKGEESTIDLVFMDPILQNKIVEFQVRQDLDQAQTTFRFSQGLH
jgi:hypothetical protein